MIPAEGKAPNIKLFKKEDTFYQYMDRLLSRNGYVLLVTSPLKKREEDSSTILTGQTDRKN
ncbi:MAG TPA: hypothetical protein PKX32_00360 [Candidatus Saccharicenans sp.]|jgi:hypothetical protein|nr:hypothetical protein [Candidatus Saccharicenans sp.]